MQAYPVFVDKENADKVLEFKDIGDEADLNDLLKVDNNSSASEAENEAGFLKELAALCDRN
jgi:hypothetical protein